MTPTNLGVVGLEFDLHLAKALPATSLGLMQIIPSLSSLGESGSLLSSKIELEIGGVLVLELGLRLGELGASSLDQSLWELSSE